jgi:hypothetical protein
MKFAFLLILLFALTANAQKFSSNADSSKLVIAPTQFTHADTVRALHNLFKSRQSTGNWLAGGSAAVTAFAGLGTLAGGRGNDPYFSPDAMGATLLFGIASAPAWIPGSITLSRFNAKQERKTVDAYEKTKQLPRTIRKRLSARFFNLNYRFSRKIK